MGFLANKGHKSKHCLLEGSTILHVVLRWVSPVVLMITVIYESVCVILHQRSYHLSSQIQFFFWLLMVVLSVPSFVYSALKLSEEDTNKTDFFQANVRIINYICYVILFVANFFSEVPRVYDDREVDMPTAEERASPLSTLFFSWLDPLIWAGFKAPLEMEAVPKTKHQMSAAEVEKRFARHLAAAGRGDMMATLRGEDNPAADSINENEADEAGLKTANGDARANDIEMMDIAERAGKLGDENCRQNKPKANHLNVAWPLFRAFGGKFAIAIALKVLQDVLKFVAPQILKKLIK
jgi:hypothetical protein